MDTTIRDVLKSGEALVHSRQRLEWAVGYVGLDLARLARWRVEELRKELTAFVGFSVGISEDDGQVAFPSDEEMQETCGRLHDGIAAFLEGKPVEVSYPATLCLMYLPRAATGPEDADTEGALQPYLIDFGRESMPLPKVALHQFMKDLVEQSRLGVSIKACPGPVPRRRHETCGRWFVGTAKKRFCSPQCRSRATDRRRANIPG